MILKHGLHKQFRENCRIILGKLVTVNVIYYINLESRHLSKKALLGNI